MSATSNASRWEDVPNVMRNHLNSEFYQNPGRALDWDDVLKRHKTWIVLVVNVVLVLVLTVLMTRVFSATCDEVDNDVYISQDSVFCTPFLPVDRVVVDVDLDPDTHCYSSKSCVSLAHKLGQQRYNFIIGAYGFVYVQLGYQCQLDHQGPALRIRLPVDSIYNGHDFMAARKAVEKFTEILREGLECGLVLHNYTLVAEGCRKWDSWCTRVLQEVVTEDSPGGVPERKREFRLRDVQNSEFNPLDLSRVYNYQYTLRVCGYR